METTTYYEPTAEDYRDYMLCLQERDAEEEGQDFEDNDTEEPYEDSMYADSQVLADAGFGTDEDYGYCGDNESDLF